MVYGGAQLLQTVGLQTTSASVPGFVTGMYVVFTPLLGLVLRARLGRTVWTAVALATAGLALLSLQGLAVGSTRTGDWAVLLSLALVAGALALLVQTWAQSHLSATRAAIIMTMEPVWAAGSPSASGVRRGGCGCWSVARWSCSRCTWSSWGRVDRAGPTSRPTSAA